MSGVVDGIFEAGQRLVGGVGPESQSGAAAMGAERSEATGDDDRDDCDGDAETESRRTWNVVVVAVVVVERRHRQLLWRRTFFHCERTTSLHIHSCHLLLPSSSSSSSFSLLRTDKTQLATQTRLQSNSGAGTNLKVGEHRFGTKRRKKFFSWSCPSTFWL